MQLLSSTDNGYMISFTKQNYAVTLYGVYSGITINTSIKCFADWRLQRLCLMNTKLFRVETSFLFILTSVFEEKVLLCFQNVTNN